MADMGKLKDQFNAFCNFGAGGGGKTTLTTKNLTKMFKDCGIYGKNLTGTDTDIAFSKVKTKGAKEITFTEFEALLKECAPKYGKDHKSCADPFSDMVEKINAKGPSTKGTTKQSATGGVDKMTDASQYTGAHKSRFDEDGKGKGIDGREERADNSGYVGAYKGDGTYDKK